MAYIYGIIIPLHNTLIINVIFSEDYLNYDLTRFNKKSAADKATTAPA